MEFIINEHVPRTRPHVTLPTPRMLLLLGEDGMRKMVSDHYNLLVQSNIKHMFPTNAIKLEKAKEHSADFFIQICGGPMYFNQNRGMPQLIRRHLPFTITPEGRIEWLRCYREVLQKIDLPEEVITSFWKYIEVFSNWMVNSESVYVSDHLPHSKK